MRRASLFTIFLIVFIDLVGFGILLPNQQYYGQTFGISNIFALTLIGPVYSIFQFIFAPILGKWSDRIGRRPVLLVSQAGSLLGYLLLFSAHFAVGESQALAIFLLYFSRVLDGISGGNISTAFAYVADISTPENRSKAMGAVYAALGMGFVFGPTIGGVVGRYLGLQYVPLAAAVFSIIALNMSYFWLPESYHPELSAAPRPAARTIFHAVIDRLLGMRHSLARPVVGALVAMTFVNGFAFAGMEQTFSLLIRERAQLTVEKASGYSGFLFGGIGIIIVVVNLQLIGRLTKAFGEATLVIFGPLAIAVGLLAVGTAGYFVPVWPQLIVGCGFLALGSSLFNPSISSLISRHSSKQEQGEALGASQGMASLARALGPLLAGFLYWAISSAAPYYVCAVICLAVVAWAFTIRRTLIPPQAVPSPAPAVASEAAP